MNMLTSVSIREGAMKQEFFMFSLKDLWSFY